MDKEFPNSKYSYQTHILLGDKGYTLEGLEELMKKNEKVYLSQKGLGKYNINIALAEEIIPTEYQLYQNYPNPFNPTTTINYSLPENTIVNLYVYNSMGQLVKTLVSDYKSAGSYNVIWDSTNDFGNIVSSGTYFYILRTNDKVFSNKMLLLK